MKYNKKIIETHVHIHPDKLQRAIYRWFVDNVGWRNVVVESWQKGVEMLEGNPRLEKYLTFSYAHKPGISGQLNDFTLALADISPKAIPLMCLHQDDKNPAKIVEEGMKRGFRGIKIHCQVQKVSPADKRFFPAYEKTIELGGFIILHAGTGPFTGPHVGFDNFVPLLKAFPDLKCIVAHLGAFEPEKFMEAALEHENLYLDTAFTFVDNPTRRMDAPLDLFREALPKIFFASDYPGITNSYEEAIEAFEELPLTETERDALFYNNAAKFLGLE